MKTWIKLDRLFAWILFFSMVLYFISGYGMTKQIIDIKLAKSIHNDILPSIILIAFVFHAGFATRLAFIRWGFWNFITKILWFILFTGSLLGFLYIEFAYKEKISEQENSSPTVTTTTVSMTTQTSNSDTISVTQENQGKEFTLEELSQYDGQDGNPAYVAVEGIIYDMSEVFNDGIHYKHVAGQELTSDFYRAHDLSDITKYPIVGKIVE